MQLENTQKVYELISELNTLEAAISTSKNYDFELSVKFHSMYNSNTLISKDVFVESHSLSKETKDAIMSDIKKRIEEIKLTLSEM